MVLGEAVVLGVAEVAEGLTGDVPVASTKAEGNFINVAITICITCVRQVCQKLG